MHGCTNVASTWSARATLFTILLLNMYLRKVVFLIIYFSLYGCGDYQAGYRDGYEDNDKKQWVVFGRGEYLNGYFSGQAGKFQQDWVLENPVETNALQCPDIIVRADPLMFLPPGYKRIAQDIYQISE